MIEIIPAKSNKKVFAHIKSLKRRTEKGISNAFKHIGKDTIKKAGESMAENKSGRVYRVYVGRGGRRLSRGRLHQASKVGESPAILSGQLLKSMGFNTRTFKELSIGADTPYARRHELGGRSFILRTLIKNEGTNENYFSDGIEREIMKGMR